MRKIRKNRLFIMFCLVLFLLTGCGQKGTEAVRDSALREEEAPKGEAPKEEALKEEAPEEETGAAAGAEEEPETEPEMLPPDGFYTTAEDVSLYLVQYGELPENFITKSEAREAGWSGGSLEPYAPGKCIGGDRFGNYEGLLPEDREYRECDIDTLGAESRGAKRLVFSDDGLIYYTEDHYESFVLLYGEE